MVFLNILLDIALIGLLIAGIHYAMKLQRQLADMRAGRLEMEKFVMEFNATVMRAEAGVKGLKNAARSSGDDLEKLIEKGQSLRDELHFLVESADQIATRLSNTASHATRGPAEAPAERQPAPQATTKPVDAAALKKQQDIALAQQKEVLSELQKIKTSSASATSAAERDLINALKKLG